MRKLYFLILFTICADVSQAQRSPLAINDTTSIYQGGSVVLNVLANDSNFNVSDTVCVNAVWGGYAGWAVINGCSNVIFNPLNTSYIGLDTFFYSSCDLQHTTLCDTGRVIVTIKIHAPLAFPDTAPLIEGMIDTIAVLANDINFNPSDNIRVTNIWGAQTGTASVLDSVFITYHSNNTNYYGLDSFYYRSCDTRVIGLCDTGRIVVNLIRAPIAANYTYTLSPTGTTNINVLVNDSNFNVLSSACVDSVWGLPLGWSNIAGCGQIVYSPLNDSFPMRDTFYYSLCYTQQPILCATGMVVILSKPQVDFSWYEQDSTCITEVYNNSLLADSVTWTVHYLTNNGQNETLGNINQFQISSSMPDSAYNVQICQTAHNAIGDSSVCYTFWIQCIIGSNGIKELNTSHMVIYPNPASDQIEIGLDGTGPANFSDISSVAIYDILGKELKSIPASNIGSPISVSELSPGIYLIAVLEKDQNRKMLSKFEVMR